MEITRRNFLGGATSFAALGLGGCCSCGCGDAGSVYKGIPIGVITYSYRSMPVGVGSRLLRTFFI